jgi:uncharacterized membrane protein
MGSSASRQPAFAVAYAKPFWQRAVDEHDRTKRPRALGGNTQGGPSPRGFGRALGRFGTPP